jgi:hypothetical protein
VNDPMIQPDQTDTQTGEPIKRGPKPGKAAQQKKELMYLRTRVLELEEQMRGGNLMTSPKAPKPSPAPSSEIGDQIEALAREIYIRAVCRDTHASNDGTLRAYRDFAVDAAHVFYRDPAEEG